MATDYTNDALLENIRLRVLLPNSQNLYTDDRLLMLANDELQTVIFPMMMSIKGDYFVAVDTQTMTASLEYDIPGDAVGIKIKDVYWRDPNWPSNQPDVLIPLINYQDLTNQAAGLYNYLSYYVMGNKVHITNTKQGQYLRIRYYKRAAKLVVNSQGGQVEDSSTVNIVLSNIPTTWAVGDVLQLVNQSPPFETIADDLEITAIGNDYVNLVAQDPDSPILTEDDMNGNWLTLLGETVIAQITPEAHPILAQSVGVKCLEGLNDPGMPVAQAKFQQLYKAFIDTMTPRVDGQAKKIVQRNGTLFWNKANRGGGFW